MITKYTAVIVAILIAIGLFLFGIGCSPSLNFSPKNTIPLTHEKYNILLKKHVDELGNVNYKGFLQDSIAFNSYLTALTNTPPSKKWTEEEKLAYWINAYNAFTIKLIMDNYPVASITDLHPPASVGIINGIWHKKFFQIGGIDMNLNAIEHKILRPQFEEPRIHFAIVCASKSCPKLLNEAYTAIQLEQQLTKQAQDFLADEFRNKITTNNIQISKIFSWFKGDFTKKGSLINFLNQYSNTTIHPDAKISYLDYDWSLNE
jgi:hypothetical protein